MRYGSAAFVFFLATLRILPHDPGKLREQDIEHTRSKVTARESIFLFYSGEKNLSVGSQDSRQRLGAISYRFEPCCHQGRPGELRNQSSMKPLGSYRPLLKHRSYCGGIGGIEGPNRCVARWDIHRLPWQALNQALQQQSF